MNRRTIARMDLQLLYIGDVPASEMLRKVEEALVIIPELHMRAATVEVDI